MQTERRIALGLLVCALFSLALRTIPAADRVFSEGDVRFHGTNPWYHVRLIDSTVRYFPERMTFDPWALAPDGHAVPVAPLFDQVVAAVALVVSFGSPSPRTVHVVAAIVPAVLGALIVFPVFAIGRRLWGSRTGLAAAALTAVTPGVFLDRTRLGFADHHAAESLLAALTVAGLLRALDATADDRTPTRRALLHSGAFGVWLGLYVLNWIGGFLLVGILLAWIVVQAVSDHARGRDLARLGAATLPGLAVALGIVAVYPSLANRPIQLLALTGTIVVTGGLIAIAAATTDRKHRVLAFATAAAVGGAVLVAVTARIAPDLAAAPARLLRGFVTPGAGLEVGEVQPLLQQWNVDTVRAILLEFTTGGLLGTCGLLLLGRAVVSRGDRRDTLVLVWSVLMIAATLVQVRFAYYSAVNVALLSALTLREIWRWAGPRDRVARRRGGDLVLAAALLLVAFVPNVLQARRVAGNTTGPHTDWLEALDWLREATPAPFATEDDFDLPADRPYRYPASAYSVMTWWDYGYWVLARSRRMPTSNPTQAGARTAAEFYIAQTESAADRIMDRLRGRYVLVDATLPFMRPGGSVTAGKFRSLVIWAGRAPEDYFEPYYFEQPDGTLARRTLYYPAYFRSMLVRLYLYGGGAVPVERDVAVVSFRERIHRGTSRKMASGWRGFESYDDAAAWIATQETPAQHRIVSDDPQRSCVPFPALTRYRRVHGSPTSVGHRTDGAISLVEIFEYLPAEPAVEMVGAALRSAAENRARTSRRSKR